MSSTDKSDPKGEDGPSTDKSVDWTPFTYDELRRELAGIKDIPEVALDPITTAAFLCASMPGPVRAAWRAAVKPIEHLTAALLSYGYACDWVDRLWELRARFERARVFELFKVSSVPSSALVAESPEDDDKCLEFTEPLENPSDEVSIERAIAHRPPKKDDADPVVVPREHYIDFVVLGVRVLVEAGCAKGYADGGGSNAGSATSRSALDIMCDVVEVAWSDTSQTDSPRSRDAIEKAYRRGITDLPKHDFSAFGPDRRPGGTLIESLNRHREKRGSKGLGSVWLRR